MADTNLIVRPVELVIGAAKIGKFLGVAPSAVRKMLARGAPIIKRGARGDLVCEKAELWNWHKYNPDTK